MFCPQCSQHQISGNIRFCSRCGFQLNVVKALLAADREDSSSKSPECIEANRSRRKRDMTIGVLCMFLFAFHSAWTTEDLSLEGKFTGLIIKCLILCLLINIIPVIRDFFFSDTTQVGSSSSKILSIFVANKNKNQTSALYPAYSRPAADYVTGRINTAEFVAPPSVTEETTNLLRNN